MKQIIDFTECINQPNLEYYLGNKGANLYRLFKILNIPYGFILTSQLYNRYHMLQLTLFKSFLKSQLEVYISKIEAFTKKKIGQSLKVSVRASYQYIMPGMMPTILNVSSIEQIINLVIEIYQSSNSESVLKYKKMNNITQNSGLAIIIQQMIYGNLNQNSYTGVFTTRNILSGQNKISGEYLCNATGNQLLSGLKQPAKLQTLPKHLYQQLLKIVPIIENYYHYVQQIEFTIENNNIFILQCRQPNLTPFAKIHILYDLYLDKIITLDQILNYLSYQDYLIIENSKLIDFNSSQLEYICNGISISYTISSGKLKFQNSNFQQNNILYINQALPNYIKYIDNINGIITSKGGYTSHLSSILRANNKSGLIQSNILKKLNYITINNKKIYQNQNIVIDGYTGTLYKGSANLIENIKYQEYLNFFQKLFI